MIEGKKPYFAISLVKCLNLLILSASSLVAYSAFSAGEPSCSTICRPCSQNENCTQKCEQVGKCRDRCTSMAACVEGYQWSEKACRCLKNGQKLDFTLPCGPSLCIKGEYCCNESCGICAPEGGFCTQQICE